MLNKIVKSLFSTAEKEMPIKLGSSVKVKKGVTDPNGNVQQKMDNWQGWVIEMYNENTPNVELLVAWDSVTLMQLDRAALINFEEEGFHEWDTIRLSANDVEITKPRDTIKQTQAAAEELNNTIYWEAMGDEGALIAQILGDAETEKECLEAWKNYLNEKLILPFDAEYCSEFDKGIPNDAEVKVLKMHGIDEEYGIMVNINYENQTHTVPLFDLIVADLDADNYDALEIYDVWFGNKKE
jgi:hypothetical protein